MDKLDFVLVLDGEKFNNFIKHSDYTVSNRLLQDISGSINVSDVPEKPLFNILREKVRTNRSGSVEVTITSTNLDSLEELLTYSEEDNRAISEFCKEFPSDYYLYMNKELIEFRKELDALVDKYKNKNHESNDL